MHIGAQRQMTSKPKPKLSLFTEKPHGDFDLRRELSEREYEDYSQAIARLTRFVDDQQRFDLVREGFGEYKLLVEKYARKYARQPRLNLVIQAEISNRVNGKLRNFFSEFRAFLDYTETHLKTQYGEDSKEFTDFKTACKTEYDTNVSYRFLYKLRSYGQHSGVPINRVSITSGNFDPALGDYKNHLLLEVDRDRLLDASFNWAAKVKQDIEGFPPRFELDPHIVSMYMSLERINNAVVVAMLPIFKQSAKTVVNLAEELQGEHGTPAIVRHDPPPISMGEWGRGNTSTHWIPVDLARWVLTIPGAEELAKNDVFLVKFKSAPQPDGYCG
jgi:hypothetical protein